MQNSIYSIENGKFCHLINTLPKNKSQVSN